MFSQNKTIQVQNENGGQGNIKMERLWSKKENIKGSVLKGSQKCWLFHTVLIVLQYKDSP